MVMLHGCAIGDRCIIGMGSTILDHDEIGERCIIGAGALVTPGTKIPAQHPRGRGAGADPSASWRHEELEWIEFSADHYVELAGGVPTLSR